MSPVEELLVRVVASADVGSAARRVTVGGFDVLVLRLADGRPVAFAATCPHQRTDLGDGCMVDGRIRCPLHHYEYDVTTGENVVPACDTDPADLWKAAPGYLPVFAVDERDGWLWVGAEPMPPPPSYDPARERRVISRTPDTGSVVEVVHAAVGRTFELRLSATPRPGFVWRVDTGGSPVAVVGERTEPGDPPLHVVRLVARDAGRWTVRGLYARPWDREPAAIRTYEVVVSAG